MFNFFKTSNKVEGGDTTENKDPWHFVSEGISEAGSLRQYCLNFLNLTEDDLQRDETSQKDSDVEALRRVKPHLNNQFRNHGKIITGNEFNTVSEAKLVRQIREIVHNDLAMETRDTIGKLIVLATALLFKRFK